MECSDCRAELSFDDAIVVKDGRRKLKLCEECAAVRSEQEELASLADGAMRELMDYKERW